MGGWIKDHRKELESDIWMMPPLYHRVWQYLKYKVNHTPNKIPMQDGSYFEIKKGQHLTSIRNIAKGIGWMEGRVYKEPNPKTISKILNWLEKVNMITIDRGRGNREYTLITLVNYRVYQSDEVEGVTASTTASTTAGKQRVDINKNDKNEKNDKEVNKDMSENKFSDDAEETILTKLLVKMMLDNNPNARVPRTEKQKERWIDALEKTHRLDGYSYEQIKSVIIWSQNNDFWKSNILSTTKLREKMPTLVLQMERDSQRPQSRYERTVSELDRLYEEAVADEQSRNNQTH